MSKINLYTNKGTKKGIVSLPKNLIAEINMNLIAQAVRVYQDGRHFGLSKTKTRGEVTASTRKIYRQKGTGYARHGAKSAPIFVGGGKAHGPKGLKSVLRMSTVMRRKALKATLAYKAGKGDIVAIEKLGGISKTKEAKALLDKVAADIKKEGFRVTIVLPANEKNGALPFRNISQVKTLPFNLLNAYDVYQGGVIVLDSSVINEDKPKKHNTKDTKKK